MGSAETCSSSKRRELHERLRLRGSIRFALSVVIFFACEGIAFARISAPPPIAAWPSSVSAPAAASARNPAGAEGEPLSGRLGVCRISHHPRGGVRARACPLMMAFSPGDGAARETDALARAGSPSLAPARVVPAIGRGG
jgi:hypothetical protein